MLLLTRHGETEFNRVRRYQGRIDSPLTKLGIEQAHGLGRKLKSLIGERRFLLYVSPLGRAQATAQIISNHIAATEVKTDARIIEIDIGGWEGMTLEEIEFTYPSALDGSTRYDWGFRAPKGETKEMFLGRLKSWLEDIERTDMLSIAVSHGWAGMGLRSIYAGKSFEEVSANGNSHETIFQLAHGKIAEL